MSSSSLIDDSNKLRGSKSFAVFDEQSQSSGLAIFGESGLRPVPGGTKKEADRYNSNFKHTDADLHAALICAQNDVWPMFDFYKRSYKA